MNQEIKDELRQQLQQYLEYVTQGVEFTKEQAPLYVQEYLTYHIALNSGMAVLWLTVTIGAVYLFRYWDEQARIFRVRAKHEFILVPEHMNVIRGLSVAGGVIACFFLVISLIYLLKPVIAPRVVILEYLISLL